MPLTSAQRGALRAFRQGLKVIPILPRSKKPAKKGWQDNFFKSRKELKAYFGAHPDANYGVLTGAAYNLSVLDQDGPKGRRALKDLERTHGALPATPTVITPGGGKHFYFNCAKAEVTNSASAVGTKIDVRGQGGFVVCSGSIHPNGGTYKWLKGRSMRDVRIKAPPTWLLKLMTSKKKLRDKVANDATSVVREGGRNNHLASVAGTLRRAGAPDAAILGALVAENEAACLPPLAADEVSKIAESIAGYPVPTSAAASDAGLAILGEVLRVHFAGGANLIYERGGFWRYQKTHWREATDDQIKGAILKEVQKSSAIGRNTASALISQVHTLLKAQLASDHDRLGVLDEPPQVINCANGELWIAQDGSVELKRHRPESYLRHCLSVNYDPSASCKEYDKALTGIFARAKDPDAMIRHWHELSGYIIQPTRNIATILILLGVGHNGKTKLAETLLTLLGNDLVCALPIQNIEANGFAIGELFGKLVLYDDDVKAGIKLPDGLLKKISERKQLTADRKFKSAFNFIARTVPLLLCNNVPSLADLSAGMRRRLQIIPFDREFTKVETDDTLFDRIMASEMPGVLNRAIQGLQRIRRRGGRFDIPKDIQRSTESFMAEANPLPAFIKENCEKDASYKVPMKKFYNDYKEWAKDSGITLTQQRLTVKRNLVHMGFKEGRGGNQRFMRGLRLKP